MIPFENFSQSSSLAYFKYEEKLHLYDPVISNMVSERYRCANYSDLEDEEDEADFAYESEEEEFSNPKKEEDDSVSEVVEISHCEFIFGSFGQESTLDIVHAIPIKTIKPKIEGCTVKIGQITCSFNTIKSETCYDDSFSFLEPKTKAEKYKTEKYSKNVPPSTNLLRHSSCLEFGNTQSPTSVSSPETIVFAKPPRFSLFSFDPGGASKDKGYTVRFSKLFLDPLSTTICVLVSFLLSTDPILELLFSDLIFAKIPKRMILVFDPGGSHAFDNFTVVRHLFDVALTMKKEDELVFTDLISPTLLEDLILIFDPGGSHMIGDYFTGVHHPPFLLVVLVFSCSISVSISSLLLFTFSLFVLSIFLALLLVEVETEAMLVGYVLDPDYSRCCWVMPWYLGLLLLGSALPFGPLLTASYYHTS